MWVFMWEFSIRLIILFICSPASVSLTISPLVLSFNKTLKSQIDAGEIIRLVNFVLLKCPLLILKVY